MSNLYKSIKEMISKKWGRLNRKSDGGIMSEDIGPILKSWKYTPNDINVRIIDGQDGRQKLQMRLDLGILQMDMDGRPDGRRPHRFDSYLSYYESKSQKKQEEPDSTEEYLLSPLDCLRLQQESIQYYHRYLALMKLGDYSRVIRDTGRNLRVFDFVYNHSDNDDIQWSFNQYRPYVTMMHTRAKASISIEKKNYKEALYIVSQAIDELNKLYDENPDKLGEDRFEVEFLEKWSEEIVGKKPLSQSEELSRALEDAVNREEYELAAKLRDDLQALKSENI
jgi:hypothetical protein